MGDPWEKKNGLEMEPASVILRQEDTLQPFRPYSEERTQSSESKRTDFTYGSATRHLRASGSYSESSCVPLSDGPTGLTGSLCQAHAPRPQTMLVSLSPRSTPLTQPRTHTRRKARVTSIQQTFMEWLLFNEGTWVPGTTA